MCEFISCFSLSLSMRDQEYIVFFYHTNFNIIPDIRLIRFNLSNLFVHTLRVLFIAVCVKSFYKIFWFRNVLLEKNGIMWEKFPSGGLPSPTPPVWETTVIKKNVGFIFHFRTPGTFLVFAKKITILGDRLKLCCVNRWTPPPRCAFSPFSPKIKHR